MTGRNRKSYCIDTCRSTATRSQDVLLSISGITKSASGSETVFSDKMAERESLLQKGVTTDFFLE